MGRPNKENNMRVEKNEIFCKKGLKDYGI